MYISVHSPDQEIIVFNIPVIIAKKNQINAQWLKPQTVSFKNLTFDYEFTTMKEVVDGVPYNATQSKKEGKGQESIQPSTTPDPGH